MEDKEEGFFDQKEHEVLAIAMSDDFIALGTHNGYKIFTMNPIKLIKDKDLGGGIGKIGFYNSDKIIWFVGGGDCPAVPPNEVRLWDNHIDEQLWKVVQKTNIKDVKVKPDRMLVTLSEKVYLYSLPLSDKFKSFDTVNNPYGVSAIATLKSCPVIAFLGEDKPGSIVVLDYSTETLMWMIEGDESEEFFVTQLCLNSTGTILACATSEGCSIHLYNTSSGDKIKDFTRSSVPSTINFLSFQLEDSRLVVSSEAGTIHIFMMDSKEQTQPQNHVSYFSFLGGIIPYLGKIGSYWKFRTPEPYKQVIMPNEGSLVVLASTAKVYLANINVEEGGEAILETKHTLTDSILVQDKIYRPEHALN